MKKIVLKLFFAFVFALLILNCKLSIVSAATRTWDGGGGADTNWSTCANWDGPDICPTSADVALFNSTSTNNSTVDANFAGTVNQLGLNAGYTGTVTLARSLTLGNNGYVQTSGTFNAGANDITDGFAFLFSGGTFIAPSTTFTITRAITISGSAVFNANGGTIVLPTGSNDTLSCNNATFNLVQFTHTAGTKTVSSNCNLPLGNNPTIPGLTTINGGILSGSGTLTSTATALTALLFQSNGSLSGFTGLVDHGGLVVSASTTLNLSNYNPVIIYADGATIALSISTGGTVIAPTGELTLYDSVQNDGTGTFTANGGTVALKSGVGNRVIIRGSAPWTFNNLNWDASSATSTFCFTSGTTTTILGSLILKGTGGPITLCSVDSNQNFTPGVPWYIDARGGRTLSNLIVSDSNNINSQPMYTSNSRDNGNNVNWIFGTPNISFYLDYPGGNSHLTNTNPTYRWKKATVTNNSAISKYELYIQPKDLITNASIGTRLYIDNIIPFVGDNKKYAYYTNYTLYDDGDFLNLTPANYKLTPGKYNFRVVAHDSAGNVREESLDFFVDNSTTLTPTSKPIGNYVAQSGTTTNQSKSETSQPVAETPTPEPTFLPVVIPETVKQVIQSGFPWWILILIPITFLLLFLFWKKRKSD